MEDTAGLEAVTEELENLDTTDSDDTAVENNVENIELNDAEDTSTTCDTPTNVEESESVKAVSVGESENTGKQEKSIKPSLFRPSSTKKSVEAVLQVW